MARTTLFMKDLKPCFCPSYSNGKTGGKKDGMMSIGYMPGLDYLIFKNTGLLVTDCKGTCGGVNCAACQEKCYAISTVKQYEKACINRIQNTMQLRSDINAHFADIEKTIVRDNIKIVRYTESGELESLAQLVHVLRLAQCHTNVFFYLYTKNYNVLREFFNVHTLPDNMVILVSVWESIGVNEWNEFKKYKNIKCFAVNSNLQPKVFCPAYKLVNGKAKLNKQMTCAKCRLCFDSKAKIIGCYEH